MRFALGGVNVGCRDLERSLAFYRDILGFEPETIDRGYAELRAGRLRVHLFERAEPSKEDAGQDEAQAVSIDLMVDNIEEAYEHCESRGVAFKEKLTPAMDYFVVRDPDGLTIEIIEEFEAHEGEEA